MTTILLRLIALGLALVLFVPGALVAQGGVYYVATDGSDDTGDGSQGAPWATITHALDSVPDDSTVLVKPGTYTGRVRLRGQFAQGVTVRAEVPYQARLRNDGTVVTSYYGQGITLEGFDIAHSGPGAGALVIQIQDLIDGAEATGRITLRNNVLHDSYNNDILKINNGARDVLVEGNLFYNQAGSDEHMDVNSVQNVVIQDNVFFNDFAGSGRSDDDTSSFVVIKDSNGGDDGILGSEHVTVRRNVFLHWEGSSGQGFVRVGEDATANHEARDVLIENNLMIGNNTQQIRSPFQLMGVYSVTIRANTVVGDMPAKEFGARIFTYGANPNNDQIHLHNNIWSDPTGTMGDTFNRGDSTDNLTFDNNLFWNAGNPFPTSPESIIEVTDDAGRVVGDPLLGDQSGLVLPRWDAGAGQFADGSATIRAVFERLVALYGAPASGSPAVDAADPAHAPAEDILGQPRTFGSGPDIGAYEVADGFALSVSPASHSLSFGAAATSTVTLSPASFSEPVTLTLRADATFETPPSVAPSTLVSPTRFALLTLSTTLTDAQTVAAGWHTVALTGTGGGYTATAEVRFFLYAQSVQLYLPVVLRK